MVNRKTLKSKQKKRWTHAEELYLLNGVAISGIRWLTKHCHKSLASIHGKLRREYGKGGLTRGAYTLMEIADKTGYSRPQLIRAQKALAQKWKRLGPRGAYIITEEQLEDIVNWLSHDYWDKQYRKYCCGWCHTGDSPHKGRGLCQICYYRYRRICEGAGISLKKEDQIRFLADIPLGNELRDKSVKKALANLNKGLAINKEDLEVILNGVKADKC